jgi:hypothetical protein
MLNISGLKRRNCTRSHQGRKKPGYLLSSRSGQASTARSPSSRMRSSKKMGRKDIIKVEGNILDKIDLDVLGYIDHNITVDIIEK